MTQGRCESACPLGGRVCPTGAIAEITAKEKIDRPIKTGSGYLERGRCLPRSGNAPCIFGQEHCPTSPEEIHLVKDFVFGSDRKKWQVELPFVDLKR